MNTEKSTCDFTITVDKNACQLSYTVCSVSAKAEVEAYYNGRGASIDNVAERFAKSMYNAYVWQSSFAGCFAALLDEYRRLYG